MSDGAGTDQLAWEGAQRRRIALLAAAAAVCTLLGGILLVALGPPSFDDRVITLTQSLQNAAEGRTDVEGAKSLRQQHLAERPLQSLGPVVLVALGALLLFPPLAYLLRAWRAREPGRGQLWLVLLAAGAVLYGVGNVAAYVAYYGAVNDAAAGRDRSFSAIVDRLQDASVLPVGQLMNAVGALALGTAVVAICLGAMRVGVLTRFLGVLGVIVGGTLILSGTPLQLDQQGLIRSFWLAGLALLLLGRLRGGLPPAWASGSAEPWPSGRPPRRFARDAPEAPVAGGPEGNGRAEFPAPKPRASHPSSKKKRRRR